jgi:xylulokinase
VLERSGFISTSGKALEWFMRASGGTAAGYERLFGDVAKVPAGADRLLFLPYLAGERSPIWDPDARGAFVGLTLNHGTREMSRAVVESVAYAVRDVIEVMEEAGAPVRDLRITGRPSRSPVWNQIKADVTGRRILVPAAADPDLAGDASLALYGLGDYARSQPPRTRSRRSAPSSSPIPTRRASTTRCSPCTARPTAGCGPSSPPSRTRRPRAEGVPRYRRFAYKGLSMPNIRSFRSR